MEFKELTNDFYKERLEKYNNCQKLKVLRHALSNNDINEIVKTQDDIRSIDFQFEIDIKTMTATNQKQSGRCWIFSALNVLREIIAKKLNLKDFELSQSYVAFYDKLEKINYELEAIISLLGCEHDDRTLETVMRNTFGDGGQWDMFVNVVNKYGVVPKNIYPETQTATKTQYLNKLMTVELNKFAAISNDLFKEGGIEKVREYKEELLAKAYNLLVSCYGLPVDKFDFEYTDKDGNYHIVKDYTPLSFYNEYFKEETNNYISLINAPTKDKPFNKSFTIDYLGNVAGGKEVKHLNVTMDRMIELILAQLKDNRIVWFGSDVSFYRNPDGYQWDDRSYDFDTPFGLNFYIDKAKSLDYSIAAMNHAMCITGVAFKDGVPSKWKIENSWGTDRAKNGYYLMSDTWFNQYVFQAVVDKKYLTKDELDSYNETPIRLKPWDPMGSLAD